MPQDSLRSVVYRSFVTCDGSKGVVECKKIRKSKKTEQRIKKTSSSHDQQRKEKKPSHEELQSLSCLQMMEVSRGAERLNEVIDSLSNRPSVDRPSKQIATDLLRGALDLQESLAMIGKLQEASKYIVSSKKKEKIPFGSRDDYEKPRISADVAPKDCYEELREAIREGFARQNLLPNVDRKHSELCVDLPSSISTCSSTKQQGPSLIAKLMGLEEVPSKGAVMEREKEWIPYGRSRFLDIDLPRSKKPEFMVKKVVRERLTLEEIIETMQFKGILRRKSVDRSNHHSNASFLSVDGPPIVIMRPLLGDGDQIHEEENIISRQVQMPRKTMRAFPRVKAKESSEKKSKFEQPPKQKINKGKEGKNSGRVGVRSAKKILDIQDRLPTTKMKSLVPQVQKKEAVPRKTDKIQKVGPNARKPDETNDGKPQRSDRTQDFSELTIVKHTRNVRENYVSKSQTVRGKGKSIRTTPPLNPSASKKNPRKGEPNSKPSSSLVENIPSDGDFAINIETNIKEPLVNIREPELSTEEVVKAPHMPGTENSLSDAAAYGPITEDDLNHIEDGILIPNLDQDKLKDCKSITYKRQLLLRNASFLNHAEELFGIMTHESMVFQTTCSLDGEVLHDPLLLDCAEEILQRKSMNYRRMSSQWSQHLLRKAKCHLSMEQLVEEICEGIDDLHNYSKSCGDGVLADSIYPILDRDLQWSEEVTGGWDSGWRKGYTAEAVDGVMHEVEELVLSEIVGDVIIEIIM